MNVLGLAADAALLHTVPRGLVGGAPGTVTLGGHGSLLCRDEAVPPMCRVI